ncbi:tetratricopeptide repeat protein [Gilvibacter sp.]|uniref:type IX secretion system periplasmic lipoprotein PorW/SprE n=1 Tax=Gilvibacter sp. TaxID=2729997 RepID=UPI003F49BEE4
MSCSTKKDGFINRNLNAVAAEYNKLYNGQVAFDEGRKSLADTYRDNYWEILPVERLEILEDVSLPGQSKNPNFEKAEEKAAKAIQKNSMYIDGKERNPQMDEAFILLGKARYFDQRFIPALEAFNYVLSKYPTGDKINTAKIWKAKANIRLNNEEIAIDDLNRMIKRGEIEDEDLSEASAMIGQAYINLDTLEAALPYIKTAAEYTRNNENKGRLLYIQGQLYNRLQFPDSANMAFDEVIALNRKTPRIYMINAYIEKAKNFNYETGDKVAFLELLTDLAENRENRPYLDKIYHQIGVYHQSNDSIEVAMEYYNKSIKANQQDDYLQARNYVTLGTIFFDRAEYQTAGAYYDSTLVKMRPNTLEYRRLKKKRDNLDDVIQYELVAATNDSILNLVNMTAEERLAYFTEYTDALRAQAIQDSIDQAKNGGDGFADNEFFEGGTGDSDKAGAFYFYNTTTVAYGKQEFRRRWGDRELEDDWRRSDKNAVGATDEEEVAAEGFSIGDDPRFKPETYLATIPTEQGKIDTLITDRNFAYYQLGLIYKEKFKEYPLAAERLETLLTKSPEERLVLPSKYNLYKIYNEIGNADRRDYYKNDITANYPDSRYAEIINNPDAALATDESSPEFKYNQLFAQFEASQYDAVIAGCDQYITTYNGNDIVPKLELLKATALGRRDGFEAYKKALNFVALNYPNSEEGKKAQFIYSTTVPRLEDSSFLDNAASNSFKLVYSFKADEKEAAQTVYDTISSALTYLNYQQMSVSKDFYTPEQQFVVVHGLDSKLGALGFGELLRDNKRYKVQPQYFSISRDNYKVIQIHKNLAAYIEQESTENPD